MALFVRIGGEPAVQATVDLFYTKVLGDAKLAPFFAGSDMASIKSHQVTFMSMAFGSPGAAYDGRSIAAAHHSLIKDQGLNGAHFDLVAGHLVASLQELGVPAAEIGEVVAIVGPLRPIFDGSAP
jgi:hemoglobin